MRHLAFRTEQAYLHWIRRYVKFHGRRHPRDMGLLVLDVDLPWPRTSMLSVAEVRSVLAQLDGTCWLMANLLYGSGLRLMEAHRLRVKDLALDRGELIVRDAKGGKDRVTLLPAAIISPIREHLAKLFDRFRRQRRLREPGVSLPTAIARKYPNATTGWGWRNCWGTPM